jgi:hypothetical protein
MPIKFTVLEKLINLLEKFEKAVFFYAYFSPTTLTILLEIEIALGLNKALHPFDYEFLRV